MKSVVCNVARIIQSYDSKEGISVMEENDMVYVDITKEFPTPGYIVTLERVLKNDDEEYKIYLKVKPPPPDRILPQIITYKTLSMEIPKEELGNPPYKFKAVEMRMA